MISELWILQNCQWLALIADRNLPCMGQRFDNRWWNEGQSGLGSGGVPPTRNELSDFRREWTIIKGARFNAAKRFERLQSASTLSIAIAGFAGFLAPVVPLLFRDTLSAHTERVFEFTAYWIGGLSITLGLYDLAKNLPERARQFHECGKAVNRTLRRLKRLGRTHEPYTLDDLIAEYDGAIENCPDNHDDIDYQIGRLQFEMKGATGDHREILKNELKMVRRQEWRHTYWLYGTVWLAPILVAVVLYFAGPREQQSASIAELEQSDNGK